MVVRRQRGSGVIGSTCEWQGALARPVCHRSDLRKPCQSGLQLGGCLCHSFSRRSILHCYTRPPPAGRHVGPIQASESRLSTTSSSQTSSVATPRSPKAAIHYASLPRRTVSTSARIPFVIARLTPPPRSRPTASLTHCWASPLASSPTSSGRTTGATRSIVQRVECSAT